MAEDPEYYDRFNKDLDPYVLFKEAKSMLAKENKIKELEKHLLFFREKEKQAKEKITG